MPKERILVVDDEPDIRDAGLPKKFSSPAAQGSRAPSKARKSEAVGPSDSTAGGRPGGRLEGGRRASPGW